MSILVIPSITPFQAERINHDALAQLVDFYAHGGAKAVFALGTTGEFALLSTIERKEALETIASTAQQRLDLIVHIGATSQREVIELGEHALSLGVKAAAVITPYFFAYTQTELEQFYRQVCAALPTMSIYAYTIPQRAGNNLELLTLERLRDLPNLVGIKDSSGDLQRLYDLLELRGLEVYAGADGLALPFLQRGGAGLVSGLGAAIPEVFEAFSNAIKCGDLQEQQRTFDLVRQFNTLMRAGSRLDFIRAALAWRGLETGVSRAPLPQLTADEATMLETGFAAFAQAASQLGIELQRKP